MKSQVMASMADLYNMEMMADCSCGRDKSVFICTTKECPNHTTQQFFCGICASRKEAKHIHFHIVINEEV